MISTIQILLLSIQIFIYDPSINLHKNVIPIVKDIRKVIDRPLVLTSNYRDKDYNKQIGGNPKSRHLCGKAVDIRIRGLSRQDVLDITKLSEYNYDVVVEHDHIHIETRGEC